MAKKAKKGTPVKKSAKPIKKAVAKKPAKKTPPKKAAKPAKKAAPKKVIKKLAPKKSAPKKAAAKKVAAKKVIAKKVVKKVAPKKVVKKVAPKKAATKKITVKKVAPKKAAAKKAPVKRIAVKKAAPKKVLPPQRKTPVQIIEEKKMVAAKKVAPAKPVIIEKPISAPPEKKPFVSKKKQDFSIDMDEDNIEDAPMVMEYKTPSVRKPMGPVPTPFINKDKRTRYTDPELKEFKQLILKKLSEAQKDYELLKSTLSHRDDHGTDDTSPTFKLLEDGSDVLSKEETAHLAGRQEKFIQNLQNALIRIENKTYGICRSTGKLISKERLRSVPHATLAIEAKLGQKV